ncbi:microtubule-associated tumor suppressor 1 homolog A [Drosophila busckii]|uniref:microtubule-associated tumor suppressor 1 homolog A n=1 Tax=Drosophila busckii TaxID=30019 RepID=UPI001432B198|nr:microtubule-associated tumor suppressor 1 homolog A [Drosophila busckii]
MDRSSSARQVLYAELAAVKAQNVKLEEENVLLHHRLNRVSSNEHTNASVHVEAKIQAFQMQEERDRVVENLQMHKKKYNKLHDAYLEKVKRCKALEEMFKRQKALTGLVMKSAIDQRNSEQQMLLEQRKSQQSQSSEVEQLQAKLAKMQQALDESYDIIDEMDFELESVDLLEVQNQRLRDELAQLKAEQAAAAAQTVEEDEDEPPPKYEAEAEACARGRQHVDADSCESCLRKDDADANTLERAAMTESLIQTVEAESNVLRRELLRSRQRIVRAKLDKMEAEDAAED